MDANTEITLDGLHAAIVVAIRGQFPSLDFVEAYSEDRDKIPTPACLVELTEFEADADTDPGTGQLSGVANFSARFLMGFRQPGLLPKLEIRKLALAFAAFAHKQRWGQPVGAAQVVGAWPDDFDPELDQYEVWRVEWRQTIDLGETVWKPTPIPTTVHLGTAPAIGPGHVDDYEQIAGE
ncbi:MAG: hypothetical protein DI569_12965 [Sphingopyxis macrogoltabida]|uniref:Uncharacterized protein n=1 Tax=Sphingopyxis macrogoltabida TaxID=33050 RepID=A0A2W5KYL4_SPHMC|nr:MAG: hypothetical protein DI569_12965 [Sphingopyxis macrogoltabida]